jgi:hypothetical protein
MLEYVSTGALSIRISHTERKQDVSKSCFAF